MNINYDKELDKLKSRVANTISPPRLLLHVCCAPCATASLLRVLDCFDTTLYYSNDNITSDEEWNKRLAEVQRLTQIVNDGNFPLKPLRELRLVTKEKQSQLFFDVARGLEGEREGGARCTRCFEMRLTDAERYAEAHGFDFFGTTLTLSPYKNSQLLNEIGLSLQTEKVKWLPSDFKKQDGYNKSIQLCALYGIYRQHYCGCCFSHQVPET